MSWQRSATKIGYDQAGITVDPRWHDRAWTADDLRSELTDRLTHHVRADQVVVDHYRVGHHWAFRLPVDERPSALPSDVAELTRYPWLIWLTWELTERWDVLAAAAELNDDEAARSLWQQELAALDGWQHFRNWRDLVGLPTGHLAMALARGLVTPQWDPALRARAEGAGRHLLHGDIEDWYDQTWRDDTPLHNIPLIVLCSVAALARVLDDPIATQYATRAREGIDAVFAAREREHHTEQTAYNGYLFDAVTQWLEVERAVDPGSDLIERWREPLLGLCPEWTHLTVPGRADLAVPLGDVEPEMTMWLSCVARLSTWYGAEATAGAARLWRHCAPERLPAAALHRGLTERGLTEPPGEAPAPSTGVQELPSAVTIRDGWGWDDPAVAIGLTRTAMGHLHADSGSLVLAWQGRCWITDPGYQQYRRGEERDYTVGPEAHNNPVVDGKKQTRRAPVLIGTDPVTIGLTDCYEDLSDGARIIRTVSLDGDRTVVTDEVGGVDTVDTHWLAGALLAWAFVDGWLRLSDGRSALWVGTGRADGSGPEPLDPDGVLRQSGSRGPVGLRHTGGPGVRRWQFVLDRSHGWEPPTW